MNKPRTIERVMNDYIAGVSTFTLEDVGLLISRIEALEDQWDNHYCEDYAHGWDD